MEAQVPQAIGLQGVAPAPGPQERGLSGIAPEPAAAGRRQTRSKAAATQAVEPGGAADLEPPPEPAVPFEAALLELERIVHDLEGGDLGLEQSLRLYERGVALVRECAGQLDAAEARVRVLSLDADGRPALTPLQEDGA